MFYSRSKRFSALLKHLKTLTCAPLLDTRSIINNIRFAHDIIRDFDENDY